MLLYGGKERSKGKAFPGIQRYTSRGRQCPHGKPEDRSELLWLLPRVKRAARSSLKGPSYCECCLLRTVKAERILESPLRMSVKMIPEVIKSWGS